jgi:rubrerythrin
VFTTEDLIDIAIQIDKNAESIYRKALQQTKNVELRSILQWLVEQESRHVEWFSALRKKVKGLESDHRIAEVGREILLETIGGMSFSLAEAKVSEIQRDMELMRLTIEFEKDKVQFFKMLRPFVDDSEAKQYLEKIIAEEKKHVRQLQLCASEEPHRS